MGRRLRYQVAMSLDGFIAGPKGDFDWIVMDPAIDFAALFEEFDTAVMGRKTYGGGELFRSLLAAGLVDTVEPAVIPVLLGSGVPLLPPGATTKLVLADQKTLPASGILALAYSVPGGVGPAPRVRYVKATTSRAKKRTRTGKAPKPAAARKRFTK